MSSQSIVVQFYSILYNWTIAQGILQFMPFPEEMLRTTLVFYAHHAEVIEMKLFVKDNEGEDEEGILGFSSVIIFYLI